MGICEARFTFEQWGEAKDYLIEIDMFDKFMSNMTSTDGYSLVYFANIEWGKRNASNY